MLRHENCLSWLLRCRAVNTKFNISITDLLVQWDEAGMEYCTLPMTKHLRWGCGTNELVYAKCRSSRASHWPVSGTITWLASSSNTPGWPQSTPYTTSCGRINTKVFSSWTNCLLITVGSPNNTNNQCRLVRCLTFLFHPTNSFRPRKYIQHFHWYPC